MDLDLNALYEREEIPHSMIIFPQFESFVQNMTEMQGSNFMLSLRQIQLTRSYLQLTECDFHITIQEYGERKRSDVKFGIICTSVC